MRLLGALLLLLGLTACSIEKEPSSSDGGTSATRPSDPAPSETESPDPPGTPQPDASASPACAEVRAGIDAFNAGDFAGTVDHFLRALPLARAQASTKPSRAADDLLEAVTYYAQLAPEDYLQSAASSPRFAKYKAITLGQCVVAGQEPSSPTRSPGVTT